MRWWHAVQDGVLTQAPATGLTTVKRRRAASPGGGCSGIEGAHLMLDHRYVLRLDEQWVKGSSGADAGRPLTPLQCQVLYWSRCGRTIAQIASRLARPLDEVLEAVSVLRRDGIVALRPAGRGQAAGATLTRERRHIDTLPWLWRQQRARYADRPYIRLPGDGAVLTYGEAGALVEAVAHRLRAAGVAKGDRVALLAAPHPDSVLVFWAATSIGAIVVPISSELPRPAQQDLIERCAPKIVFAEPRCAEAIGRANTLGCAWTRLRAPRRPARRRPVSPRLARRERQSACDLRDPVEENDAAVILFTSGSTGVPKGVVLSQGALCRSARLVVAAIYEFRQRGRALQPGRLPLDERACATRSWQRSAAGASFVLPDRLARHSPWPRSSWSAADGVTVLSVVPELPQGPGRLGPSSGAGRSGQRPLRSHHRGHAAADAGGASARADGGAGLRLLRPDRDRRRLRLRPPGRADAGPRHDRPAARVIAQIVDEQGKLVRGSGVGELRIYSENVMSGYYREPELTRTVLRDGWLYTGDLVSRRRDGRLVLHGRKRDVVKDAQGELIYLTEIEAALEEDPAVAEAAVCDYRDPQGEEQFAAFIRARPATGQQSELVSRLRRMLLTSLGARKVPQRFVVVADLPRCGSRKVDKRQLVSGLLGHGDV